MKIYKLLKNYSILIFIWIIIFIITIINRLFFHFFIIILDSYDIGVEGIKALAEALKLNKNLTELYLRIYFLFIQIIIFIVSE